MARRKVDRQSSQLKIRVDDSLKARLEEAAKTRGNSLNAEVTERLVQSLDLQKSELIQSKALFGIMQAVAAAMSSAGQMTAMSSAGNIQAATNWFDNPWAYEQALQAAVTILEVLRPEGEPVAPQWKGMPEDFVATMKGIGLGCAKGVIMEAATGNPIGPLTAERAKRLHRDLSLLADRFPAWALEGQE